MIPGLRICILTRIPLKFIIRKLGKHCLNIQWYCKITLTLLCETPNAVPRYPPPPYSQTSLIVSVFAFPRVFPHRFILPLSHHQSCFLSVAPVGASANVLRPHAKNITEFPFFHMVPVHDGQRATSQCRSSTWVVTSVTSV